jgi:PKD repeat protein
VAVTWSLINRTGGVVNSDLVAAGDARSATFTGHATGTGTIRAQHATLGEDTTGVVTVTAGTADRIRIEDAADGTGAEIDTRTIASGASFTGYAISRDASDNFVANVAVTWSLINRTGGVVNSDLVAAGDARSATFTGHAAGTGRIEAQHATLGRDSTGIITVTVDNQPPVALFKFTPASDSAPCEICFDASASYDPDGHIVSYDWDFGDGSRGHGVNTCHTFTFWGNFLITLRVVDNDGLSDTATAQINLQAAVFPPINVSLNREINRSLFKKEAFHTIRWSLNPENGNLIIISYRIYRKEASNGNASFQLIGSVSGGSFAYVDGYLSVSKKFIYAVTAVESTGRESKFSSLVRN